MSAEFELKLAEEQIAILRESIAQLEAESDWMRREIERVGHALYTGTETGYVGTEEDLQAIGQTVEGVIETMGNLEAENKRLGEERDQWKGLYEILATDALLEGKDE